MKTKTYFSLAFFLLGNLFVLFSQTETRNVGPFDKLEVNGHYTVTLIAGEMGSLNLRGDSDDLKQIETYVKKGTLIIKQKKSSWIKNWTSGNINIEIQIDQIQGANLSGSGSISSKHLIKTTHFGTSLSGSGKIELQIETDQTEGFISGSGQIILAGKTNEATFKVSGSGDIKAKKLMGKDSTVQISGSGSVSLHAENSLEAMISGSGDLFCYGKPEKQVTSVSGSGNILFKD